MLPVRVDYLGEGRSDEAVARKVILAVDGEPGTSYLRPLSGTGKQNLDSRLPGLNAGVAYGRPTLVLRDLDHDAPCPPALVARLLPNRHPRLLLRICVRELETWLMADKGAYARFCGMSHRQVSTRPESLDDPKQTIVSWAERGLAPKLRRHIDDGRRRGVPDWAILGEWHANFADQVWSPLRAAASGGAPSLARTLNRLRTSLDEIRANA